MAVNVTGLPAPENPNPERLRKWVEALRSGEYSQTKGRLRTDEGYCCLGVACDVFMKEEGGTWEAAEISFNDHMVYVFGSATEMLPSSVAEWFGIHHAPQFIVEDGAIEEATALNDELGWDFVQIAEAIERTYGL
jgi:hypothetical protein